MLSTWEALKMPWPALLELAWEGYCAGSLPIGAVITDEAGAVVARGRNRLHEDTTKAGFISGHRLAHAEVNALLDFDDGRYDPQGCTLYTTTEPCPLCVGAVRMMGMGALVYASRDPWAGCAAMFESVPYLRRKGVRVSSLAGSGLEAQLIALQTDAHLGLGAPNTQRFLEVWRAVVPVGVAAGEQLFEVGHLQRLKERGEGAPAMFRALAQAVRASAVLPTGVAGGAR